MLPNDMKVVILIFITFAVTEGLKIVSGWIGRDLSGTGSAIAAALTSAVIVFSEALLALIPVAYQPITSSIFSLLIALLAAFGVHAQLKKMRPAQE